MLTRIRCDTPCELCPLWLLAVDGNDPVKGLIHAREPMLPWSPFRLDDVRVGAAWAQMCACLATAGVTSAANALFQCKEGMFHPRLANLFEALGVICAAAHAIKILWNDGMIGIGQREPIDRLVAIVARIGSYCQTNLCSRHFPVGPRLQCFQQ